MNRMPATVLGIESVPDDWTGVLFRCEACV